MEKNDYTPLPQHDQAPVEVPRQRRATWKLAIPVGILFLLLTHLTTSTMTGKGLFGCAGKAEHGAHMKGHGHAVAHHASLLKEASCPAQPKPISVGADWDIINDESYADKAAGRLSRAVQINTVSFDDMPSDPKDPRFDGHTKFAKFLEDEFPTVYSGLKHEIVNEHAHLFTWEGSSDRKPIYLMAHEDTVPVNKDTEDQWTFGPWSGEITKDHSKDTPGTWVWGRGASDCKNSLMGILGSIEKLLEEDFKPERTILIGYGYDEEIGGGRGALPIAELIEERYGKDGVEFIIDEGFSGISDAYGARVAALGMAEKGSMTVKLTVNTPGGHSSMPPPHTGTIVNHRIAFTSSVHETKKHYKDVVVPVAKKLGFSISYFGEEPEERKAQHLTISVVGNEHIDGLEPAPITPADSSAFGFIGGTIKTVFGKHTVIAPTGMFANTDTARTWNLTRNIYRFSPSDLNESGGIHTVDERISLHGHLTTTQFYYKLIRNTEGWEA
ncbi:vacuole protein [Trichosporon asahii var. asahii CBS 8904]|uniref:Vacuole protein n=1 Tax=Trichosporon asahii var. asahii (strain CBS 8904) TaxID=1220162 RepID=K1V8K2_TRIAC|nr:vacuole protein [Trichosporon asahii var. asahii CBS 8904]